MKKSIKLRIPCEAQVKKSIWVDPPPSARKIAMEFVGEEVSLPAARFMQEVIEFENGVPVLTLGYSSAGLY